jgi:acyl-CoA synthetase (AMP-forming)/AMP-acid ligase II
MKTTQLRRYEIQPGAMDAFVEWFSGPLVTARTAHGFHAESAFVDSRENLFIWVVSHEGAEDEFLAAEKIYEESAERAMAFESYPGTITAKQASIVRPISV